MGQAPVVNLWTHHTGTTLGWLSTVALTYMSAVRTIHQARVLAEVSFSGIDARHVEDLLSERSTWFAAAKISGFEHTA